MKRIITIIIVAIVVILFSLWCYVEYSKRAQIILMIDSDKTISSLQVWYINHETNERNEIQDINSDTIINYLKGLEIKWLTNDTVSTDGTVLEIYYVESNGINDYIIPAFFGKHHITMRPNGKDGTMVAYTIVNGERVLEDILQLLSIDNKQG